jgi:outer membrane murein-binding lipoprotein Lpp
MKKPIRLILAAAWMTGALGATAQTTDELAALRQQIQELSAKVEQLEKQQAEKISTLEQQNETRIAKLEKDAAKSAVPAWVTDTKFKGDFRYRYENIASDSSKTDGQDRQRVRLRVGAYGKVNEFVDYGVRLATSSSATSSEEDINGGTKKGIWLDQCYVDMHPELFRGAHLFMGKMPQPWVDRTGLIWDSDFNPEGIAATYKTAWTNGFNLMANAGSFVLKEDQGDDLQLWTGQLAGEAKVGDATIRLGGGEYYYQAADKQGGASGANTAGTGFNLVEGFGSVGMNLCVPVVLNGQYVVNTDASSSEDTAYLAGITVGAAKDKGSWEAGYNFRDTGRDAVPDNLNDGTFAAGRTGSYGHSFWAKYQLAKNLQGCLTYMMATDDTGEEVNTLQADLLFKF